MSRTDVLHVVVPGFFFFLFFLFSLDRQYLIFEGQVTIFFIHARQLRGGNIFYLVYFHIQTGGETSDYTLPPPPPPPPLPELPETSVATE
jgi:hypothetical protein